MREYRWAVAYARCRACDHCWIAVYPLATDPDALECSRCGLMQSEPLERAAWLAYRNGR